MKSTCTCWLGCLGLILLAGCSGENPTPSETASGETSTSANPSGGDAENSNPESSLLVDGAEKKLTVGFSVLTLTNPFFKIIADEMTAEGEYVTKSSSFPPIRMSIARHKSKTIVKQVSAIVLNPCDSKAIGAAIKKANDAESRSLRMTSSTMARTAKSSATSRQTIIRAANWRAKPW